MNHVFEPIGMLHSCFKEKFGIPRQAGLAPSAWAEIEIFPPFGCPEALRELESFSHIWLVFVFHSSRAANWRPTVRPPRLGGNKRVGVFASRSPFRPNPIGISSVKLEKVHPGPDACRLVVSGVDLLDGTPVLDIKPYIPWADSIPGASGGFASQAPEPCGPVQFSKSADAQCKDLESHHSNLRQLITEILQNDPRPAYSEEKPKTRHYGTRVYNIEVKWVYQESEILVTSLHASDP